VNNTTKQRQEEIELTAQRILDRCDILSKFTETPGQISRTFLCPAMREVHKRLRGWMEALGMQVRIDAMGNLRGVYSAQGPLARRLLLGSHVDTVPRAGAYDGVLGVLLALGILEALDGRRLKFEVEVIAFSEEEGVRFRTPFLGSRALIGDVDEDLLQRLDSTGTSVREAILNYDLDPERINEARLGSSEFAYVEFHIEQGPVLHELGIGLGIVEAIVGQTRLEVAFHGQANHAGTTPMKSRKDALPAAAELALAVESEAGRVPGLVATVGRLATIPGATNVIPGEVELSVDIRHRHDDVRGIAVDAIANQARYIATRRGLSVSISTKLDQPSVVMAPALVAALQLATKSAGYSAHRMVSGAGHDAMIVATRLPVAMLFLRSPHGISHHPDEAVLKEDVFAALQTGLYFLNELDAS
jgi:allantoate deiminase